MNFFFCNTLSEKISLRFCSFMGIKSCFYLFPNNILYRKYHFIPEIPFYTGNNILYRKSRFPFCASQILENNLTFLNWIELNWINLYIQPSCNPLGKYIFLWFLFYCFVFGLNKKSSDILSNIKIVNIE